VIYSFISYQFPNKFNSPDESAAFFFINEFINNNDFIYEEPLNPTVNNLIRPRSVSVINNNIVPFSFIGFYLIVGIFGKIIYHSIYFVVPFFSVVSIIFFYFALKKIFTSKIALLSCILLFIHPALWYFSSLPFFHNSLFVSFLLMSFYFLIKIIDNNKIVNFIFLGLFLGLLAIVRVPEIIWIIIGYLIFVLFFKKKINLKLLIITLIVFLLIITPILFINNHLYDNPFTVGYLSNEGNQLFTTNTSNINHSNNNKSIGQIVLPNGLDFSKLIETFSKYIVKIFLPFSLLSLLGILLLLKKYKQISKIKKTYLIFYFFICCYLLLYYGSGSYFGAAGDNFYTISSSLVRYWLPVYVFGVPFITYFIYQFILI
jgi:4-amino-4-deoxy-L-arabinose transferase-like glycosyltransferase